MNNRSDETNQDTAGPAVVVGGILLVVAACAVGYLGAKFVKNSYKRLSREIDMIDPDYELKEAERRRRLGHG